MPNLLQVEDVRCGSQACLIWLSKVTPILLLASPGQTGQILVSTPIRMLKLHFSQKVGLLHLVVFKRMPLSSKVGENCELLHSSVLFQTYLLKTSTQSQKKFRFFFDMKSRNKAAKNGRESTFVSDFQNPKDKDSYMKIHTMFIYMKFLVRFFS